MMDKDLKELYEDLLDLGIERRYTFFIVIDYEHFKPLRRYFYVSGSWEYLIHNIAKYYNYTIPISSLTSISARTSKESIVQYHQYPEGDIDVFMEKIFHMNKALKGHTNCKAVIYYMEPLTSEQFFVVDNDGILGKDLYKDPSITNKVRLDVPIPAKFFNPKPGAKIRFLPDFLTKPKPKPKPNSCNRNILGA